MEAGPELDAKVARACNLRWTYAGKADKSDSWICLWPHTTYGGGPWRPSTNLEHAFEAAELAGLLNPYVTLKIEKNPRGYRVAVDRKNGFAVTRETLPLAICRVIELFTDSEQLAALKPEVDPT